LETDTHAVLDSDGKMVGYATVWDSAPHVRLFAQVRVHPECTDQSIEAYLNRWAEDRALQAIPKAPEGARVALSQNVYNVDTEAQELLRRQEYQPVRHYFVMTIEMDELPPEPIVPEGITIRHFCRETELPALVHTCRDAFRDHWGYVEAPFEDDYEQWVTYADEDDSFDETLWFVATKDNAGGAGAEIVGCSVCYDVSARGPDVGEVETLGVRRQWRRRGIALALLQHSFRELYRRGKTRVILGVDAQSLTGALRLYEKAGMHVQYQADRYEKELRAGQDLTTQELED
jgi:mycothiol synthase